MKTYTSSIPLALGEAGSTGVSPCRPENPNQLAASTTAAATRTIETILRRGTEWHSREVPEGGVSSTGVSVADLPPGVTRPFEVYVNGVRQEEGSDFRVEGRTLIFGRSLEREGRLGAWKWLRMLLGIAGSYGRNDSVDVVHAREGRRVVETGLPLRRREWA